MMLTHILQYDYENVTPEEFVVFTVLPKWVSCPIQPFLIVVNLC